MNLPRLAQLHHSQTFRKLPRLARLRHSQTFRNLGNPTQKLIIEFTRNLKLLRQAIYLKMRLRSGKILVFDAPLYHQVFVNM